MPRLVFLFSLFFSAQSNAEDLIAVLDMEFIKDTGETAADICFDEAEEQCDQWASFYLYKAKVRRLVSGSLPAGEFYVIYGRHALRKIDLEGVIASLHKLPDQHDARYQLKEIGHARDMYCFHGEHDQPPNLMDTQSERQFTCFEKDL